MKRGKYRGEGNVRRVAISETRETRGHEVEPVTILRFPPILTLLNFEMLDFIPAFVGKLGFVLL